MRITELPPLPLVQRESEENVALVGELRGIADQVHDDLAQPHRIAAREHRHVGIDVDHELDALHGRLQRGGGGGVVDHIAQVEVDLLQVQPVSLDLGEIQHVVDQREQRLGAAADEVDVFALGGVELGLRQDLRHADHAVHGRADFVAHVREEIALRAVRRLGGELGLERRLFGELAVGHVDERAGDAQDLPVRAVSDVGLLGDPALAAPGQEHAVFAA